MTPQQVKAAERYARAATSTRCARMGDCDGCQMKFCDYRSHKEAYLDGYASAIRDYGIITEHNSGYGSYYSPCGELSTD